MANGTNGKHKPGSYAVDRMTADVPTAKITETIADVEDKLIKQAAKFETLNYIYVIDDAKRLIGVFSIKELFRKPKTSLVKDLMKKDPVAVFPHTHQERVALTALAHSIKAVPVVDRERILLGVVPSDVILDILHEEQTKDLLRFAGIQTRQKGAAGLLTLSPWDAFRRRVPWLVIGLLGGIGAASVVEAFELTLNENVLLAAFIPAIVYMADAVGTQTQTIFIRALAIDRKFSLKSYLWRESQVGLLIALALGSLIGFAILLIWKSPMLAVILSLSFFFAIMLAVGVAILMPSIFNRAKLDPAIASGPFATVIRDVMTLVVYFTIASELIERFGKMT